MLGDVPPQRQAEHSQDGTSAARVYFALAMVSIVAYLLASEALRNFFIMTLPQIAEKLVRS